VLVVDDQDSGRFVKVQMLRRAGFTVHEAASGRETLDIARDVPFDLVVLDVNLPDISGLVVGRLLREQQPGPPAIQILHVSSTAVGDKDRAQGLDAGADAYLSEPIEPTVLIATAKALLRVRRAEQSLADALTREQQARADAEHANQLKDDFIATLSHELRTPLNALMGWIFQLRQAALTEPARRRALDSLERNTRVQAQLINDLLDVSRAAKGKLPLQMRLVNMATVARDALESASAVARHKGVDLDIRTQPAFVAGDEGRLQQIIGNLLNNAIQFTPAGGRITLTVSAESGSVVVRVADTGAGIEPALLPNVFEPFRQGKDGLARTHGGLGLGLAVVHQLVELHDGETSVSSDGPGKGATFTVRVPEMPEALRRGTSALLLDGLDVLVEAALPEARDTLAGILESSGAHVLLPDARGEKSQAVLVDVVVRDRAHDVLITQGISDVADAPATRVTKPVRPAALIRAVVAAAPVRVPPAPATEAGL
jgi:signal transduction histidine kinase